MCGIIGYVGERPCRELILAGLERLEYRGYDSAGFALLNGGDEVAESVRAVGNLARLRAAAGDDDHSQATAGIGHTRWATHGRVTEANAHPHSSADGSVWVVMNGIIENYATLRGELQNRGVVFSSDTDTEVIPQLIATEYAGDLAATVRAILPRLAGHFAFVAAHTAEPGRLVAARRECPLVVGVGEGERFVASAIPAFLHETRDIVALQDDEVVVLEAGTHIISTGGDRHIERAAERVDWDEDAAEKGGYETFMLKEIHEQPSALWDTLGDRLRPGGGVELDGLGLDDPTLARVERVHIIACGTSYHAGLVGRYLIEDWARIPVQVEVASEYRYRTCLAGPGDLVLGITQSGETADTLAAMRVARERGAHVVAVTNIMGSQATRDADGVLYTRAGLEIGVAATKTHTAQVMALALLALKLGRLRWALTAAGALDLAEELRRIPDALETYLASTAPDQVIDVAGRYADRPFFLYLGRHVGVPVSFEGALKLKEISYIPTEAYPAGEMKHGPIALLEEGSPVVVVATDGHVFDKVISNIQEVRARGARVIAVATEGNSEIASHADDVLWTPRTLPLLAPITAIVPLQLFAYGIAKGRGLNVDQPRNLAKTVTVE
ncbi:MAG: glutamine--fructose-6-phosphate transaminase (isomerizing) [Thermoleophilia bacterium]